MPSHLRLQAQIEPVSVNAIYQTSPTSPPPAKKARMSLMQTYMVASSARSKLGREANRADHNLRLLVGHANLLDSLMLELSSAEREQESWFNTQVRTASKPEEPKNIQWLDQVAEAEEETSDNESDDESEYDEEEEQLFASIPVGRMRTPPVVVDSMEIDDEEDSDIDEEFDDAHVLQRVSSSRHSLPELLDCCEDDSYDSEDESMPSSPESQPFELDEKQCETIMTTVFYDPKAQQGLEDYIIQRTQQPSAPIIAAY